MISPRLGRSWRKRGLGTMRVLYSLTSHLECCFAPASWGPMRQSPMKDDLAEVIWDVCGRAGANRMEHAARGLPTISTNSSRIASWCSWALAVLVRISSQPRRKARSTAFRLTSKVEEPHGREKCPALAHSAATIKGTLHFLDSQEKWPSQRNNALGTPPNEKLADRRASKLLAGHQLVVRFRLDVDIITNAESE